MSILHSDRECAEAVNSTRHEVQLAIGDIENLQKLLRGRSMGVPEISGAVSIAREHLEAAEMWLTKAVTL